MFSYDSLNHDKAYECLELALQKYQHDSRTVVQACYDSIDAATIAFLKDKRQFKEAKADYIDRLGHIRELDTIREIETYSKIRHTVAHYPYREPSLKEAEGFLHLTIRIFHALNEEVPKAALHMFPYHLNSVDFSTPGGMERVSMGIFYSRELGVRFPYPVETCIDETTSSVEYDALNCRWAVDLLESTDETLETAADGWNLYDPEWHAARISRESVTIGGISALIDMASFVEVNLKRLALRLVTDEIKSYRRRYSLFCEGKDEDFRRCVEVVGFTARELRLVGEPINEWAATIDAIRSLLKREEGFDGFSCIPGQTARVRFSASDGTPIYPILGLSRTKDSPDLIVDVSPSSTVTKTKFDRWTLHSQLSPQYRLYLPAALRHELGMFDIDKISGRIFLFSYHRERELIHKLELEELRPVRPTRPSRSPMW